MGNAHCQKNPERIDGGKSKPVPHGSSGDVDLERDLRRVRDSMLSPRNPVSAHIGNVQFKTLGHLREIAAQAVDDIQILHEFWAEKKASGFRIGDCWQLRYFTFYRVRADRSALVQWQSALCYFSGNTDKCTPLKQLCLQNCVSIKSRPPEGEGGDGAYFDIIPEALQSPPLAMRIVPPQGQRLNTPDQLRVVQQLFECTRAAIKHENPLVSELASGVAKMTEPGFELLDKRNDMDQRLVRVIQLIQQIMRRHDQLKDLNAYITTNLGGIIWETDPSDVDLSGLISAPTSLVNLDSSSATAISNGKRVIRTAKHAIAVVSLITRSLFAVSYDYDKEAVPFPRSPKHDTLSIEDIQRAWRDMHGLQLHQLRVLVEWVCFEQVGGFSEFIDWVLRVPSVSMVQQALDERRELSKKMTIKSEMIDPRGWVAKWQRSEEVRVKNVNIRQTTSSNVYHDPRLIKQHAILAEAMSELEAMSSSDPRREELLREVSRLKVSVEELELQILTDSLVGIMRPSLGKVTYLTSLEATPAHKVQLWTEAISRAVTMVNLNLASVDLDPIGGDQMPGVVMFLCAMSYTPHFWAHMVLGTLFTLFEGDLDVFGLDKEPFHLYPEDEECFTDQYVMDGQARGIDPIHYWRFLTGALKIMIDKGAPRQDSAKTRGDPAANMTMGVPEQTRGRGIKAWSTV